MKNYTIIPANSADLEFIYSLFEHALAYQKRNNYPVWNGFDKEVLIHDCSEGRLMKLVMDDEIACIFSICNSDPIIWGAKGEGDAIFLHRIVVNPAYKGQKHVEKILNWTIALARQKKMSFIRMDTWAENPNIIEYYKSFGFQYLGDIRTPDSQELAVQQRNLNLALLEYPLI